MSLIRTQGIIIAETNTGEADKILTVFTKKYGKIQAVAKGARRTRSNMIACAQFLVFSDFILFKGKDIYKVNTCDVIEPFYNIRNDIVKLTYACYAAEIIKEVIHENLPSYRVLQLFLNTLFSFSETDKSPELIIRAFEIRLMALIGFKPHVDSCTKCGNNEKCSYFSFDKNGLICEDCNVVQDGAISVSDGTVRALRYIIKAEIKKLFAFAVPEIVLKELKLISEIFLREKLEKDFRTLKFLGKIDMRL